MKNLNHLVIFDAVAQERSVSKGADRLMVSQPAVSKQLKDLERAIGTPLFSRIPRGVRLTQAGELLAGYARRIVATADEAQRAMDELRGLARGRLSIGASTTIGVYLLPEVFMRFRRKFPGIQIDLQILNSQVIQRRLTDRAIDIGLTEGMIDADGFEMTPFMEDELVAIAPPKLPLSRKRSVTASMLCREPFIVRETGSGTKSLVERALADQGLTVHPAMSLGSTEAIKRAVAAGIGVAIVSRLTIDLELRARELARIKLNDLSIRRPVHYITLSGSGQNRRVTEFVNVLNQTARQS